MKDIRTITLHGTYLQVEFDYWKSRRCNKCGKKIWLAKASNGRYIPIEEKEGAESENYAFVSHFSECQTVKEGEKFKN